MTRLLDTNVLIDALHGIEAALALIIASPGAAVSMITWIEVLAGARTNADERAARAILDTLTIVPISLAVAETAWRLRRDTRLKLLDSIILATARVERIPLYTRNTKDFDPSDPSIVVPYTI
ncbi:MAG: PIN domain-containing protein [Dehalococcoidia bacterium]